VTFHCLKANDLENSSLSAAAGSGGGPWERITSRLKDLLRVIESGGPPVGAIKGGTEADIRSLLLPVVLFRARKGSPIGTHSEGKAGLRGMGNSSNGSKKRRVEKGG